MQDIKKKIVPVLKKYGVIKASIFGSLARGDFNKRSDIDILVTLKEESDLFDFIGLKQELEEKLRRKVDLVESSAIKTRLKNYILSHQSPIYNA
ncbi:hypothetical protein A3A46_04155 [Candidatus Roizmanbacteria bacterium RIFCSPLOWO2_01_FULL_37_13]|uniref:Polymerase beta nucleotidyltransferase domain-containing protein n=1 Tax=Candidatus Roizmanbacteria bacterium RIFCSPHIGHO2_02_FULL_38_11 TaxID=1802039 RepID=A0A1F7H1X9_9BACT|nr:MAG: hypothetical protein A3C25_03280 [Candidatus Roizmanbacteria bacterium RIFCSPHIGHO2_02_FULL_38_11]OGK35090.1 MAG: hypothetical protein A3F58_01930 [Candidatus Roizmanbacteria bacterium RIFCSPHIGHO2_12_FULL_37_9b]OGK40968.1 MAG: hypothetical protein A3A46_04155 [Candidatus Roizmanbacteria bacterium RIFCSPLOWO2_01_FULL_37_13]